MAVGEFELLHGIVLTRLMRAHDPRTMRLMEHDRKGGWSVYTVSGKGVDDLPILIKTSIKPRESTRSHKKGSKPAYTWQHTFSPQQIAEAKRSGTWAALVCGTPSLKSRIMEVCLLEPDELAKVIDLGSGTCHSLTVKKATNNKLWVNSGKLRRTSGEPLKIARDRLDEI